MLQRCEGCEGSEGSEAAGEPGRARGAPPGARALPGRMFRGKSSFGPAVRSMAGGSSGGKKDGGAQKDSSSFF